MLEESKPTKLTMKQTLQAMREKLSGDGWCRTALAKDSAGFDVDPRATSACKWCLSGAMSVVTQKEDSSPTKMDFFDEIRDFLRLYYPPEVPTFVTMEYFNDSHNQADVLALLDRAIAGCKF